MEQYNQFYNYNNFQGNFNNYNYNTGHEQFGGTQLPPISQPYWLNKKEETYGLDYINTQKSYDTFNSYNNYIKPIKYEYDYSPKYETIKYDTPKYEPIIYKSYEDQYPRTKKLYNDIDYRNIVIEDTYSFDSLNRNIIIEETWNYKKPYRNFL